MEADKVIETTTNRDTKIPGGTTGGAKFNQAYIACLNNLLHLLINKFLLSPTHFQCINSPCGVLCYYFLHI